jgi:hypothetical protein
VARDIRTLNALCPYEPRAERQGTHHDGLADAVYQAHYVQAMLERIGAAMKGETT